MAGLALAALLGLHAASHWLVHDWLFPDGAEVVVYGPVPTAPPPTTSAPSPVGPSAPALADLAASGADPAEAYGPGM